MEGEADPVPRLVVTSGVSCSGIMGVVVAVNACVSAARVWMLAGVTTLDLECTMCQHRMEAGDVVRTLSFAHVFHKACSNSGIDKWLREKARSVRVLPWKARPLPEEQNPPPRETSASSSSSSTHVRIAPEEPADLDLEAQNKLLLPRPTGSPTSPEEQHPQRPAATSSSSADTSGLGEPLLRPPASP